MSRPSCSLRLCLANMIVMPGTKAGHDALQGKSASLFPRAAEHVIAELARMGEIGDLPAVEVVLRHAIFGEALEAIGVAGGLGAEQTVAANLLGRAAVIDLIELVTAAELGSDAVPKKLHQLDALFRLVAVGAAHVAVDIGADFRVLEIVGVRIEIDEAGRDRLLDNVFDLRIGY